MKYYIFILFVVLAIGIGSARAATFTVGTGGSYATIQAGITAANNSGNNEVRVKAGNYTENLSLTMSTGSLDITGGWNAAFTLRNPDPTVTLVSGGSTDRVLNASLTGGDLTFSGFLVVGGTTSDRGGGIFLHLANSAIAQIRDSNFVLNTVQAGVGNALGGAFYAELFNNSGLIFEGNQVVSNSATVSTGNADGGGVFVEVLDSANVAITDSLIQNNVAAATAAAGHASAGGAYISISNAAQATFDRNRVLTNSLQASDANHASFSGMFVTASCNGSCPLGIAQSVFDGNHGLGAAQLVIGMQMQGAGAPSAYLTDLLISRGDGQGLQVQMDAGTANLVNLTVADNTSTGLYLVPNSTITLFNSLAFHNGANLTVFGNPAQQGNNLLGVDPLFVDAANGNYHVQANSPARDAGTATPPGGLGLFDLDGNPRTFGPAPDIGAYEIGDEIFKDGFQ